MKICVCVSQARNMEEAALECCSRLTFQLLRELRAYVPRQDLRLLDKDGLPAACDYDGRILVREHFRRNSTLRIQR